MRAALISIHDVLPETLEHVEDLLALLARFGLHPVTLLVVPGRAWDRAGLGRLAAWQAAGHELAAHGWHHRALRPRTVGHRLHAAVISRHAGEHLSRPPTALRSLLAAAYAWFPERGLWAPSLYVPPGWALGALTHRDLAAAPFDLIETLYGVREPRRARSHALPVIGFEADSPVRVAALRLANGVAGKWAREGWLRIALHPYDRALRLADAIEPWLARVPEARSYRALQSASPQAEKQSRTA